MPDFNRLKTEKEAKRIEPEVSSATGSENKSAVRAIARFIAAQGLYPELSDSQRSEAIIKAFYGDAKFQPSWESIFIKAAEKNPPIKAFLEYMKINLGTPQARGRRRRDTNTTVVEPPKVVDPDATLGPPPITRDSVGKTTTP